ncbi:MAG: acetolactate synthase, partial [Rhodospirillales bacterium]|nr:acetolactate synthase [Rhodospirillales bacterium]
MDSIAPKGQTVADAYLSLLSDRGVDYLFANSGTDFAPLIEGFVKASGEGRKTPVPVTVPHENVAVSMAM